MADKKSVSVQYLIGILLVGIIGICSYYTKHIISYQIVALLLLVAVSVLSILFEIMPVLVTAILSALVLNYFFLNPLYTFHIETAEDLLLFLIYLIVALVSTILTFKIRQVEKTAREKEEKEKTIALYNTMLNSLSHELRTPIATILGSVDTLNENRQHITEANHRDLLNAIDSAAIRLDTQVANMLNMSRLESGLFALRTDWCDINELIDTVIEKPELKHSSRHIEFTRTENLPLFKLDAGLIEQAIVNILKNAVQYTPEGSVIRIRTAYNNNHCIIEIADNGNGFPENEIQYAFDKFYRLPQTKAGGIGLGLSIVKGFIETHDGTITLKNAPDHGAVFTVSIPAQTSFITNLKHE